MGIAVKGREGRLKARAEERDRNLEKAQAGQGRAIRRRSRTTYAYLESIVENVDLEDTKAVARKIVKEAKAGNPKAWDWLGKYVLGNGKISLSDLSSPSILARKS